MDVRIGLWRRLSTEELMLLNCGIGEDSWESLGLQGDPISPSERKSVLNIQWKDWCWSRNSNSLAPGVKNWLFGKDPDAGKDWRQEEKGTTEDEMIGWHCWLKGHEFEQAPGDGEGQGSLVYFSQWSHKELHTTLQVNNNKQIMWSNLNSHWCHFWAREHSWILMVSAQWQYLWTSVAVVLFLWKFPDLKNLHSNKESEASNKDMAKDGFPRMSPTCLLIVNRISRV